MEERKRELDREKRLGSRKRGGWKNKGKERWRRQREKEWNGKTEVKEEREVGYGGLKCRAVERKSLSFRSKET